MKRIALLTAAVVFVFVVATSRNMFFNSIVKAQSGQTILDVHSTTASCTPPAGGTCKITLTWPNGGFADTNYTVVCGPAFPSVAVAEGGYGPWVIASDIKTTTVAVTYYSISHAPITGAECIGIHD